MGAISFKSIIFVFMEEETGWLGESVVCDLCGHEWVAVYHEDCDKLECPNCENMVYFDVREDE